jgi:hypothetical protein
MRTVLIAAFVLLGSIIGVDAGFFMLAKGPDLQITGTPITTGTLFVVMTNWTAVAANGKTPYVFSDKTGALPAGITVNSSTGVVGGAPTVAGTYPNIIIEVTDNSGATADLAPYTLSITPTGVGVLSPSANWDRTLAYGDQFVPDLPGQPGVKATSVSTSTGLCATVPNGSGFSECAIGNWDTYNSLVVDASNTPVSVTVGAAIGDRAWIDHVTCYLEGGAITILNQKKNPTTGSGGWTFQVAGNATTPKEGEARLVCDMVPVNGNTRRLSINIWINDNAAGTGYVNRTATPMYVNPTANSITDGSNTAAAGVDPRAGNFKCNAGGADAHLLTNDGLHVTFDCAVNMDPTSALPIINISGGAGSMSQPDCTLTPSAANGRGINGCYNGTTSLTLGRAVPQEASPGVTWSNNVACSTGGTLAHPFLTLGTAANCMSSSTQVGGTIYVPDGTTLYEMANRVCVGGSCKGNSMPYQVLACIDFPTCSNPTGSYTISIDTPNRSIMNLLASNVYFKNAHFDMGRITELKGCNGGACNITAGESVACQSCTFDDPNGAGGPDHSGYWNGNGATTQMISPQWGGANWYLLDSELSTINAVGPYLFRNTTGQITWDVSNISGTYGIRMFNFDASVPLYSFGAASPVYLPMRQRVHYDKALTIHNIAYNGTDTTFNSPAVLGTPPAFADDLEIVSSQAGPPPGTLYKDPANVIIVTTWNVCNTNPTCNYGPAPDNAVPIGYCPYNSGLGCTVTVHNRNLIADGVTNGDQVTIWEPAHPDALQFIEQPSSTAVKTSNIYMQRFRMLGDQQEMFNQGSGFQSNGTIMTDGTGVATLSSPTDFTNIQPGQGIKILGGTRCDGSGACTNGQNQFQYREILTKCSSGFFTDVYGHSNGTACSGNTLQLESDFSPNIISGLSFGQNVSAKDVACVACRIGGRNAEYALKGQMQNHANNWLFLQSSIVKGGTPTSLFRQASVTCPGKINSSLTGGNQCSIQSMRDFVIFDSVFEGLHTETYSSTGHPLWTDTHQMTDYNFDNNHWLNTSDGTRTQNPGTNQSCPAAGVSCPNGNYDVAITDTSYRPDANLVHTMTGTVGNPNVADGTPMFPWDADGTAIASGAVVGAMQPLATAQWDTVKVGGGGWVTGIEIAADGTKATRTDTYGGYYWTGTAWTQLVTKSSMPAGDFGFDSNGDSLSGGGIYEIAIAPSNTSHFYMIYNGYVFSSTNHGGTWTRASPAQQTDLDPNSSFRWYGVHLAVDPNNENIVYAGEATHGLFKSSNAGSSWSSVGSVAASADAKGIAIAFDPNSTHPGNVTQGIYVCSNGTGVYHSTDGGSTWTLTSSGPTSCQDMIVTSAGVVWLCADNGSNHTWKYTGTWSNINTGSQTARGQTVQVVGSNVYVAIDGTQLMISTNGGSTWTDPNFNDTFTSADVPWLGVTRFLPYGVVGRMRWDPIASRLYESEGIGVMYTTAPAATTSWQDQTAGIENMVGVKLVSSPDGSLNTVEYDRPTFHIISPTTYPTTQGPNNNATASSVLAGWDEDYATTNTSYLALYANWQGIDVSAYSNNGGSTWTLFPSHPSLTGTVTGEGSMAVSTPTNSVIAQSFGTAGGGTAGTMYYTTDNGSSWHISAVSGGNGGWGGAGNILLNRHIVCADRVTSGTFYAYGGTTKGVYKSTDGGINWSRVHTGALNIYDGFNAIMRCVPGNAGNLFWTAGGVGGSTSGSFYRSTDGGATWTALPNVLEVYAFGFGAPSTPGAYPAVYIFGWVSGVPGIYRSDNADQATPTWTQLGSDAFPLGSNDLITWVEGDATTFNRAYVSFRGSSFAYWH